MHFRASAQGQYIPVICPGGFEAVGEGPKVFPLPLELDLRFKLPILGLADPCETKNPHDGVRARFLEHQKPLLLNCHSHLESQ